MVSRQMHLFQEGYIHQLNTRNDPTPSKYMKEGLSTFHLRVMNLFDSMNDDNHNFTMDNLYNLKYFCRYGYNHKITYYVMA